MLPSTKRLTRRQVSSLLETPGLKVVFNRLGTLKYIKTTQDKTAFTVVTGSKHQKRAVLRNKIRRQLYTLFDKNEKIAFIGILYVSKQVYDMSYIELKTNLDALVQKSL